MKTLGKRKLNSHTLEYFSSSKLCDSVLNSSESRNSVQDLKTLSNTSEESLTGERTPGQNLRVSVVYVLNKRGKPLMPCSPRKARILLRQKKAEVVNNYPFTIQLVYTTGENKQETLLGVDAGYGVVGLSVVTDKLELYAAELELRKDIVKLLSQRKQYRRTRRSRNLWHREPRFLNRGIKKGWLAPSIQHKLDSHIKVVENISKILPISKIEVEIASFDIQKIKNPDISGSDYQQGEQLGFWNAREYVLHRDNHKCQYCKGKSKDKILRVHHLISRQIGGNRPENLLTLCTICHDSYHRGEISLDKIKKTKFKGFKAETFMNIVRWRIVEKLREKFKNVEITYGYITKSKRIDLGISKTHSNDAFVIAGGSDQKRSSIIYKIKQKRRNNRSIQMNRKGIGISIKRKKYKYSPRDLVKFKNKMYKVLGVSGYGKYIQIKREGKKKINTKIENVKILKYNKGIYYERIFLQ